MQHNTMTGYVGPGEAERQNATSFERLTKKLDRDRVDRASFVYEVYCVCMC